MRKLHFLVTALFAFGGVFAVSAPAQQTLVLNGGQVMNGRYDGGSADTVFFIDEHGNRHRFNISEVQDLRFNDQNAYRNAPDGAMRGTTPEPVQRSEYQDTDAPSNGAWNRTAAIPAGTEVVVRTIDRVDANAADPQRRYMASIERDVVDSNGRVVIPRGASAHLIVRNARDGRVAIDLRSVNVNGQRFVLDAADLTNAQGREGVGANRRTGEYVGGGAIIGGILGAVVGGGEGAAVGAAAGGAAGAGAEIATSGPRVRIPSETVLRFRLDHPVYLYR